MSTITLIDYAAIRAALTPRTRTLTWDAQRELLHRHDAPDDADWPAPHDRQSARDLLERLPRWARCRSRLAIRDISLAEIE